MRTNIDIDDRLLADVMGITGARTKREAVHRALEEVRRAAKARRAFDRLRGIGWRGRLDRLRRGRWV